MWQKRYVKHAPYKKTHSQIVYYTQTIVLDITLFISSVKTLGLKVQSLQISTVPVTYIRTEH